MPRTGGPRPDPGGPAVGPPSPVRARPATPADAAAAAALHVGRIDQGFLSVLGPRFLGRLYRRICLDPGSFLLVAARDGRPGPDGVVGFIAGSVDVPGLYRSLPVAGRAGGRRPRRSATWSVHWRRVLETLRHGSSDGTGTGRGAELLAIAVDRGLTGRGVGRTLVTAFLDESGGAGRRRRPRGGRGRQPGRRGPLPPRRVRGRRTLRAPRRHRVPAHAVGPAGAHRPAARGAMTGPLIVVVAAAVTLVVTPLVMVAAGHLGVVDRPGALKPQPAPSPTSAAWPCFARCGRRARPPAVPR